MHGSLSVWWWTLVALLLRNQPVQVLVGNKPYRATPFMLFHHNPTISYPFELVRSEIFLCSFPQKTPVESEIFSDEKSPVQVISRAFEKVLPAEDFVD